MPQRIRNYVPPPPLSAFVNLIWCYEGVVQAHDKERVLPDASMEIIVNLDEDAVRLYDPGDTRRVRQLPGNIISGAHSGHFVIDTTEQCSIVGISFKPGGAFPFLNMPAAELHDTHVALDDLWGPYASNLRERLLEANTAEVRFGIAEEALLQQANGRLTRHPAVTYALNEFRGVPHLPTVSDVTEQVGLSPRRFIQLFTEEVGLTPKLYCRVRRFQEALRLVHSREDVDWADVAALCGYYDQPHLIRDFQEFSGLTPTAYIAQRFEHFNHVPIPA